MRYHVQPPNIIKEELTSSGSHWDSLMRDQKQPRTSQKQTASPHAHNEESGLSNCSRQLFENTLKDRKYNTFSSSSRRQGQLHLRILQRGTRSSTEPVKTHSTVPRITRGRVLLVKVAIREHYSRQIMRQSAPPITIHGQELRQLTSLESLPDSPARDQRQQ